MRSDNRGEEWEASLDSLRQVRRSEIAAAERQVAAMLKAVIYVSDFFEWSGDACRHEVWLVASPVWNPFAVGDTISK